MKSLDFANIGDVVDFLYYNAGCDITITCDKIVGSRKNREDLRFIWDSLKKIWKLS